MRMKRSGVLELLDEKKPLKICAPMVRYSKLQFRHLMRKWGADVVFSPMITADTFRKSAKARDADFSTDQNDFPLIVQFGASSPEILLDAAEHVIGLCDGIDVNCGCPQKWAIGEKIGGYLLSRPELIQDMVRQLWNRVPETSFTKSIKIRVNEDISKTVDLCRQLEAAGVSFITIHGRTLKQKNEPADWDAIRIAKEAVRIPVFANGDIKTYADIDRCVAATGADGVMSANGVLINPALFSGYDVTPVECVEDWLQINQRDPSCPFRIFHHHLIWMTEKILSKSERIRFSDLQKKEDVVQYITDYFHIDPEKLQTSRAAQMEQYGIT
ncbi:tRNA-dihydrouridine(20a/20b) synthase [NAD(P)+]-like [Paramacrobiotus metropolitanus]|uniref:tRNA-dihydrouridine(20a/20b) synthase [NAD(P)+]-like n=1 Tax=Paramacrobiotus metropolitanus TaxID=2943436 RepID=UPI002445C66D|nr:tRNA-dihydrouridine(20a/20b) synthase [NAD(P)+]-like [Paramacrobiotus metropolitanus]